MQAWNSIFFAELTETIGRLLKIDDATFNKDRMDYARFMIATPSLSEINFTAQRRTIILCVRFIRGMQDEEPLVEALVQNLHDDWGANVHHEENPGCAENISKRAKVSLEPKPINSKGSNLSADDRSSKDKHKQWKQYSKGLSKYPYRRKVFPSVVGLKKIARLSEEDRALHYPQVRDVRKVGEIIGVACSNSFEALSRGGGRVKKVEVKQSGSGGANVYARCEASGRALLWQALEERSGRSSDPIQNSVVEYSDFNSFIENNFLIDLPLGGRKFTWYRDDGITMSRLDRSLLSESWISSFPNCIQEALPKTLSDHCPVQLSIDELNWGPKPHRMLKCWVDIPGYHDFVKERWLSFQVHGWSGHILKTKLKFIKAELRIRHLNHTANLDGKIRDAKNRLEEFDVIVETRRLDTNEELELHSIQANIVSFSKLQASMFWQKSRVNWLKEGDANSKFFHGLMSSRRQSNTIISLQAIGRVVEGVEEVRWEVFQHFCNHFRKQTVSRPDMQGLSFKTISEDNSVELVKPFLLDEIKAAVWDCDSYKSPGPDGVNIGFFKDFWDLLKVDLLNFFAEFHRNGVLTKGINSTFIALIPKVECPLKVSEFRPIALVSSIYKILAKVLANRLRSVIGNVVGESQTAFIKDRQILDGILIANEVVDDARRGKKDLLLFKVDFEKTYDSVDWGYLDEVMLKMNFPNLWRGWIMECVTTATASVLVNGSPTDEFKLERGLRQGDPLSPFIFLLAAEGFNIMMTAMVSNNLFTPYSIGPRQEVKISHLQFEDDTLLVGNKSWANVRALKAILLLFEATSGLKINFHKSMLFGMNINVTWLHEAAVNSKEVVWVEVKKPVFWRYHSTLESIFCHFFWGGCEANRKIAWIKWDTICLNRENGGLRVRRLKEFNISLLGKWVWRCLVEHDSLWSLVLRAKYGEEGGRVRFSEGVGSSWWRGLNSVRSGVGLRDDRWLLDNIRRKVGGGCGSLFWLDPWLGDSPLSRSFSRLYVLAVDKNILVADMFAAGWGIGGEAWKWRRRLFAWEEELVAGCIARLSNVSLQAEVPDSWVWQLHNSGCYSVKSAYSYLTASEVRLNGNFDKFLWLRSVPLKGELNAHSIQFSGLGSNQKASFIGLTVIWVATLYVIWRDRNNRLFRQQSWLGFQAIL
ncbi:hypothetical protein TSUD_385120 [Trifolium subterraneum]|uniref:Reverse transcriptase domain-containing protein n=1 Tax=Trifolium subterraneum TaxID=3900 RepID=A0A2Z6MEJ0_TRISU|nr:hypothetical protein TSUD_385120 [Trifolium subterraneum]